MIGGPATATIVPMSNEIPAAAQSVAQDEPDHAPIRGIVMILLAVAVLLGCWAFFAKFNSSHDDAAGTAAQSSQSASKDAGPTSDEADKPQVESGAKPSSSDGAQPADKDKDKDKDKPGASAPAAVADKKVEVQVLNNSDVPGLAARVSEGLGEWNVANVGNFADEILPQSAVFYTPGNTTEEVNARALAQQLHVGVQEKTGPMLELPGVLVIVTQDLG